MHINGDFVRAADGRTFETVDPSTGERITEVAHAGAADVDSAVRAARLALEGPWGALPAIERGRLLGRLADLVEANAGELAELESRDGGKPISATTSMDVPGAVAQFRYFSGWPTKLEGRTIPVAMPDTLCYTRQEPVGVVAQILPWNFPLLMTSWKLGAALAAGCTVVLKPAEQTPLTALRLAELIVEAGFPPGTVNVLTGDGETGSLLVDHPDVDKIAFTGSTAVGREIGAKAGAGLKRLTLELGGKSPNIILADADLDAAIAGSYQGIYGNSGQACYAASRLFVHHSVFDEVVSGLVDRASTAVVGPALDPATEHGPLISAEQYQRVRAFVEDGVASGATLHGDVPPPALDGGYYIRPTLFIDVKPDMRIAREEIFGPVLVATPFDDLSEVVEYAHDTDYGLAAGVWTRNLGNAHTLAARLRAGVVYLNTWSAGDPAAPFGGVKASGSGREMGQPGVESYLEPKTVWTSLTPA
ncbi:aldehyde dehydrogenase family protein [Amycolatopsis sp. 195334CR]|uniref:aldehyde dehydrogenase family protein n=1 Tax=Amycolatopsis sp. 195334CR TaxID=2814588 RepID=UPI001A8C2ECB|nr:aldehyde dehydrogenase family protein [Amycolatopsis sp. 195334CR]MBN6039876.1 aldehyde dehydrogenase family protein [Amycolatopsis sp. 195334CR]